MGAGGKLKGSTTSPPSPHSEIVHPRLLDMTLPPGINSRTFSLAVREFERIVGKEWVFSSEEDLSLYRDAYSPLWNEKDEPIPPVAIAPADVEQVRAVVKAANSFKIPLWTISTG